jgi:hypothetical protein
MIGVVSLDASLVLAARVLLVLIFARSLYSKSRRYDEFVGVVANYGLVPTVLVPAVAWFVLVSEGLVLLSLTIGRAITWGASLAALLLCSFGVAITINLARGRTEIDCGCFSGDLRHPIGLELLIRNGLLAGAACLMPLSDATGISGLQLINGFGAGVSLFLLYLVGERFGVARRQAALIRARWS